MNTRIYVGTYSKYNQGSIQGAWLDLDEYSDKEDFLEACQALHGDEADAELMFQDWEGIPAGLIGESFVSDEVWEWLRLSEDERECVSVYLEGVDQSEKDYGSILEKFQGTYQSREDWAYGYVEDTGLLSGVPESIARYFDYEAFARDAFLGGDVVDMRHNGQLYVFDGR